MTAQRYSYAEQKLGEALHSLVGEGRLRCRLTFATMPLIRLCGAGRQDHPIVMRLAPIVEELTKRPLMIKDHIIPRDQISAKRAKQIASELLSLFIEATLPE